MQTTCFKILPKNEGGGEGEEKNTVASKEHQVPLRVGSTSLRNYSGIELGNVWT